MKKLIFVLAALLLFGSLAFAAETDQIKLEGPFLVTTCGQSPGAVMIKMSAMQVGVKAESNNQLSASDLEGTDAKTLIVTSGTSMKGMGAAGTNVDKEIERCTELIAAAKKAGIQVVGAHVEGMARRTDSSDQASIEAVMKDADIILVIDDSDSDGYFTKYAAEHKKPLLKVKDALTIGPALK